MGSEPLELCRGPGKPCSTRPRLQRRMPPHHKPTPGTAPLPACPLLYSNVLEARLALAGTSLSVSACDCLGRQLQVPCPTQALVESV